MCCEDKEFDTQLFYKSGQLQTIAVIVQAAYGETGGRSRQQMLSIAAAATAKIAGQVGVSPASLVPTALEDLVDLKSAAAASPDSKGAACSNEPIAKKRGRPPKESKGKASGAAAVAAEPEPVCKAAKREPTD